MADEARPNGRRYENKFLSSRLGVSRVPHTKSKPKPLLGSLSVGKEGYTHGVAWVPAPQKTLSHAVESTQTYSAGNVSCLQEVWTEGVLGNNAPLLERAPRLKFT